MGEIIKLPGDVTIEHQLTQSGMLLIYIKLSDELVERTHEVHAGLNVDYESNGLCRGVEIINYNSNTKDEEPAQRG